MEIILANPRGFCAGVDRAIDIVERALDVFGAPIYVRHEVVHNKFVVDELRHKGAIFVDDLDQVPDDATVIFSAHGVSKAVRAEAAQRGLKVFDATCPLVTKVHIEVVRHLRAGCEIIMIGHAGHPEVEGTLGQSEGGQSQGRQSEGSLERGEVGSRMYLVETPEDVRKLVVNNPDALAFVTQTTLSVDDAAQVISALRERFPRIIGPRKDDICYATQNRQDAVKELAAQCDLVLVVGSPTSSNSNRLQELAERMGVVSYLIDNADEIRGEWLQGKTRIGLTAGASAPEVLVKRVIERLRSLGAQSVRESQGNPENVVFSLPRELQ